MVPEQPQHKVSWGSFSAQASGSPPLQRNRQAAGRATAVICCVYAAEKPCCFQVSFFTEVYMC